MINVKASPTTTSHWQKLTELHTQYQSKSVEQLNDLIRQDAANASMPQAYRLILSRNFVNQEILDELVALAKTQGMAEKIQQLIAGEEVNNTEARAAHHTALRLPDSAQTRDLTSAKRSKKLKRLPRTCAIKAGAAAMTLRLPMS